MTAVAAPARGGSRARRRQGLTQSIIFRTKFKNFFRQSSVAPYKPVKNNLMQFKIFQILSTDKAAVEELNLFLRSHRVVSVQKEFSLIGDACVWNFCVEYLDLESKSEFRNRKSDSIDYKDILSPSEFETFNQLRDLRKELAQKEGVPVYSVCTNEQIAAMIQNRCDSLGALKKLPGFGEGKADKYGAAFLKILLTLENKKTDETSGESDNSDSGTGQPASGVVEGDKGETR